MAAFARTASNDSVRMRMKLKTGGLESRPAHSCAFKRPFLTLGLLGGVDAVK